MIPAIGFMIGSYILTRMFQVLGQKEGAGIGSKISAAITILVALVSMVSLGASGGGKPY